MVTKTIKTRQQQKRGTSADWAKATNFVPKAGEIVVYTDLKKIKIGDGETNVSQLPFYYEPDMILDADSTNSVQNAVVKDALDEKVNNSQAGGEELITKLSTSMADIADSDYLISGTVRKTFSKLVSYLTGKLPFAGSSTVGGAANSANKLSTARTITLSGGAEGSASFDGSADVNLNVSKIKDTYLAWAKDGVILNSTQTSFSGAALNPAMGANRLAGLPPQCVEIEYSTDNGETWMDYGAPTATKTQLFMMTDAAEIYLGGPNAYTELGDYTNNQLRITIDRVNSNLYTELNKFCIRVSTGGSTMCWCKVERHNYHTDETKQYWETKVEPQTISGWTGWNEINTSITFGNTYNGHSDKIRFTFGASAQQTNVGIYPGLIIKDIRGFGGQGWVVPWCFGETNLPFQFNYTKNVTFPNAVAASGGFFGTLNGLAEKAYYDSAGNYIIGTYATKAALNDYLLKTDMNWITY